MCVGGCCSTGEILASEEARQGGPPIVVEVYPSDIVVLSQKKNITFFSSFSSSLSSHSHEHKSNEMSFCVHISLLAKIFCNHTKQCISQHFESYQLNDHHPHCCYDHHHQPELQNVQSITQSKNSNQTLSQLASTSSAIHHHCQHHHPPHDHKHHDNG